MRQTERAQTKEQAIRAESPPKIHIWRIDIDPQSRQAEKLSGLLSDDERARAAGFRFDTHRRRSITSRGMQRKVWSTCSGIVPAKLEFSYEPDGKPYLASVDNDWPLHFNLTH